MLLGYAILSTIWLVKECLSRMNSRVYLSRILVNIALKSLLYKSKRKCMLTSQMYNCPIAMFLTRTTLVMV
jgi:hypothetical protein